MRTLILITLLLLVAVVAVPPTAAQEFVPACEIVYVEYHDGITTLVPVPSPCIYTHGTQSAPLRNAPPYTVTMAIPGAVAEGMVLDAPPPQPCLAPVGPVVGLGDARAIHYAPDARAMTPYVIPAGSTAAWVGVDGDYWQIVWACDLVWVATP